MSEPKITKTDTFSTKPSSTDIKSAPASVKATSSGGKVSTGKVTPR